MSKQPPYVTVIVELEEWDDTTDAIVWLIEQKYSDLSLPKLEISKNPHTWRGIENLDSQSATLNAWTKDNQKICLDFIAEYAEIPESDEKGETWFLDGYKITVKEAGYKGKTLAEYTIKGTDRKEFQIIKEEKT
jgi:hypothetical protein